MFAVFVEVAFILSPTNSVRRLSASSSACGSEAKHVMLVEIAYFRQLPMAHHKWAMAFQHCLALSAPIHHPLSYLVLEVLKLTLRVVHLGLAIANRPK